MTRLTGRYVLGRVVRLVLTVWMGVTLMFVIPRLGRSNPIDIIIAKLAAEGGTVNQSLVIRTPGGSAFISLCFISTSITCGTRSVSMKGSHSRSSPRRLTASSSGRLLGPSDWSSRRLCCRL